MSGDIGLEVAERVLAELTTLSRKPFQRQLAKLLGCGPTTQAIKDFAEKHPDRWAQAIAIFAPLAGIQRDSPIQVNVFNVKDLSDAALYARAHELGVPLPALGAAGGPEPQALGSPPEPVSPGAEMDSGSEQPDAGTNRRQLRVSADSFTHEPGSAALPEGENG